MNKIMDEKCEEIGKLEMYSMKVEKNIEVCEKCGESSSEVDLEIMPCCGGLICWDYCLYEMPEECPFCGESIRVEPKDEWTKESYVEVVVPTVELTKEGLRLLKECRKAFGKKKISDSEIVERALNNYLYIVQEPACIPRI